MRSFAILFSIVVLALMPVHVFAAGVVNTCDDATLTTMLGGGGLVTFGCSGTIPIATTKTISVNTVIDGSGQNVILSGQNARKIFFVNAGVTLEIRNITLSNGNQTNGGAIENNGTTIVSNVTFSNNTSHWGAAILNRATGTLTVSNSTFTGNTDLQSGGAINTDGVATISASTFTNNSAVGNGGRFVPIRRARSRFLIPPSSTIEPSMVAHLRRLAVHSQWSTTPLSAIKRPVMAALSSTKRRVQPSAVVHFLAIPHPTVAILLLPQGH
jgi:hypothetical protein